jgi:pentatricopeptide repeat protein
MLLGPYVREWWAPCFSHFLLRRLTVSSVQLRGIDPQILLSTSSPVDIESSYLVKKRKPLDGEEVQLRKALVSLAQDLLNLSQYLANKNAQIQKLLHLQSVITPRVSRTGKVEHKTSGPELDDIAQALQRAKEEMYYARHRNIPLSSQYLVLKRLHGRLHIPPVSERSIHDGESSLRSSNDALAALLALPDDRILEDLAIHLLTSSLPFSEHSFLIIIQQLSRLRFTSAARSAYYHLSLAGYSPTRTLAMSLMLKLCISMGDREEFDDAQRLISQSEIQLDSFAYGILIDGCLKFGRRGKAVKYLKEMTENVAIPSLPALTSLLRDCGSRRDWTLGRMIWRAMEVGQLANNFQIDAWAYNAMWKLCRRCENHDLASEILLLAEKQGFDYDYIVRCSKSNSKPLPVRRSNKFPTIHDVQQAYSDSTSKGKGPMESIGRTKEDSMRLLPAAVPRINRPLIAKLSYAPLPSATQSRLDGVLLHKYRKLSQDFEYFKASLLQIDPADPLINSPLHDLPRFCLKSESDVELVEDVITEEIESYLSSLDAQMRGFNHNTDNFDELPECSPVSDDPTGSSHRSLLLDRDMQISYWSFWESNGDWEESNDRELEELLIERDLESE